MDSFTLLVTEMLEDMNDQQNKIDTFARTMFQWLYRISFDIDPSAPPSEMSSCPDTEMYFSNESSSAITQVSDGPPSFLSQAELDFQANLDDSDLLNFQYLQKVSNKLNEEKNSFGSKKFLFGSQSNFALLEKKIDLASSKKESKPYYFGISEYVEELAESAMKFRQKWQSTIAQREP